MQRPGSPLPLPWECCSSAAPVPLASRWCASCCEPVTGCSRWRARPPRPLGLRAWARIAAAFAWRFGLQQQPQSITEEQVVAGLGPWARGYGRSQRLSGAKARSTLGWAPVHLDPEGEIAALP